MDIEIVSENNTKSFGTWKFLPQTKIGELRKTIYRQLQAPQPSRQLLRLQHSNKALSDDDTLESLQMSNGDKLRLKDLGPQIATRAVFLAKYAGPLLIYLAFYFFGDLVYKTPTLEKKALVVHIAAICNSFHYTKCLFETIYVHRFSHATMPLRTLFEKIFSCDWVFSAYIAWHINHPKYTPTNDACIWTTFVIFLLCEIGNFSVHLALRNLRPDGTKAPKIPMPVGNPFTKLFHFVSCPNYTYETLAWIAFALMTFCLPAFLFAIVSAYQMSILALITHQRYRREFPHYPKQRRAIYPYML